MYDFILILNSADSRQPKLIKGTKKKQNKTKQTKKKKQKKKNPKLYAFTSYCIP